MRRLIRPLAFVLSVILIGYFAYAVAITFHQSDLTTLLSPQLVAATAFMAVCYGLIIPVSSWAWQKLLIALGETHDIFRLAAIMAVSQFAKYIPGNILHILGRSALALAHGIRAPALAVSLTVEMALAVLASFAIGGVALALSSQVVPLPLGREQGWWFAAVSVAILVAVGWPCVGKPLLRGFGRLSSIGVTISRSYNVRAVLMAFAAYSANYLTIGLGLWTIAQSTGHLAHIDYWYLTAVFSLAWAIGFVTPGAPAGLGVREGAMMFMLSGMAPEDATLLLITAARIATLAADAVWFTVGILYFRYREYPRDGR
jgi:uncharacterized membrane protein YbhN (UPF0104 family)